MKKSILFVFVTAVLFLGLECSAEDGKGQVGIATDIEDAFIFVNGKKKASAGDGYTMIQLPEGEYNITVKKKSEDGQWIYKGSKLIFIGEDTAIKVTIKTRKFSTDQKDPMVPEQDNQTIQSRNEVSGSKAIAQETVGEILVEKAIPGLKLVLIKPGRFMMGSPEDESFRDKDENKHEAEIKQAFYLQTTEVTQKQWKTVLGENPSSFKNCGDDCPVENVSWEDVNQFIEKLNEMLKTDKYRLPSEAEWEYACRAGSTTAFSFGQCLTSRQANFDNTKAMTGCPKGVYEKHPVPVGSFAPNAWGLYDMHGNVWEWCQDFKETYPTGSNHDSAVVASKKYIVTRGGSWYNEAWNCRSANRGRATPDYYNDNLGFRLVRTP